MTEFNAGEVDGVGGKLISLRRARARLRPARDRPAARRRGVRRALARPRRRARLRPDRPAHAAVDGRSRTSSRSATRPTCRPRRPARSRTSRPRCWPRTSPASSPARSSSAGFDGHANCFIETGFHKALLIDFNYDTEPLPGPLPEPHSGRCRCCASRALNHLGKLLFQWVYWHVLLPGPRHARASARRCRPPARSATCHAPTRRTT